MHIYSRKKKTKPLTWIYFKNQQNSEKEQVMEISVMAQPLITVVLSLMFAFFFVSLQPWIY